MVTQGRPNKVIAIELGVSESTIKVHRHNVMSKMRFRSLPELALAIQCLKQAI
ncbi:MAG: LuxR C-terminal-related transcriptional regulator [Rugosibacter sp.]|nr:LuxR C-terminal-related transcriptional regulator [Rugosibacter sp.]